MVLSGYAILVTGRIPSAAGPTTHCGGAGSADRPGIAWRSSSARGADGGLPLAPRAALTCDAVMSLVMGVMLIAGL